MKKILYLFLLSLVVVSCDKDNNDGALINSISPTKAVMADFDSSSILDLLIADLSSGKIPLTKKEKSLTAKGANFLHLQFWNDGTNNYVAFQSDQKELDFCVPADKASALPDRYYDDVNGNGSALAVEVKSTGNTAVTIDGNFSALFDADFEVAYKLTDDFKIAGTAVPIGSVISFN